MLDCWASLPEASVVRAVFCLTAGIRVLEAEQILGFRQPHVIVQHDDVL